MEIEFVFILFVQKKQTKQGIKYINHVYNQKRPDMKYINNIWLMVERA